MSTDQGLSGGESDDDELSAHNMESSAATFELEEVIKGDAIGSTLYSKRWVLDTVLGLDIERSKALSSNGDSLSSATDSSLSSARLSSLVDMTVEKDVCRFLAESGCLDLIVVQLVKEKQEEDDDDSVSQSAVSILANVASLPELGLQRDDRILLAALPTLFSSESVPALTALFALLKNYVDGLVADECLLRTRHVLTNFLLEEHFAQRVSFLLAASASDGLLKKLSRFLFVLLEVIFDLEEQQEEDEEDDGDADVCGKEGVAGGDDSVAAAATIPKHPFGHPSFLCSLAEAVKQSLDNPKTLFTLMEIVSRLCDADNVTESAGALCDCVSVVLQTQIAASVTAAGLDESLLDMCCKVCRECWQTCAHWDSFGKMSQVLELISSASSASNVTSGSIDGADADQNRLALSCNIEKCLREFSARHRKKTFAEDDEKRDSLYQNSRE